MTAKRTAEGTLGVGRQDEQADAANSIVPKAPSTRADTTVIATSHGTFIPARTADLSDGYMPGGALDRAVELGRGCAPSW